ncbi:hypothetical protein MKX08_003348 [Trichoderma sp. CBMAI-0020]|nr:hypothetical protein MKX08_003348 [Trichoderma sp. CBMAI-0020]
MSSAGITSLPKTYQAAFFETKGGKLTLKEVKLQVPGPGHILVKVLACGICHSDRFVQQGLLGDLFPRVPGHEAVGDVVAVGEGVTRFKGGERVGAAWHGGHDGSCRSCQRGMFQLCSNGAVNGVTTDGGFAEYVLLRAEAAVRVPPDADPAEIAPLLCAGVTVFNAMRNMGVMQGGLVAVQGLGGLGHLALQYAVKMGYTVVALSSGSGKQEFATQLGAHHYIDTSAEDAVAALQKLGGANMIVCTAPNREAVSPLVSGLAPSGKLIVLAPLGQVEFDTASMVMNGTSVHGWNSGHQQDCEDAIAFAHTHKVRCIVERFPFLTGYQDAFEKMESGKVRFRSSRKDLQSTGTSLHSGGHAGPEDKFWSSPAAREPLGFFGPTSFSAAYSETETSLAVHNLPAATEQMSSSEATLVDETTPPSIVEIHDMAGRDQTATHIALRILQAIPMPENVTRAQFPVHVNPNDEWMMMIGERLVATTWETFGTYLRDRTDLAKLRELSGTICINTRRILKEDHEDGLEWLESFSGPKLRWEAVGIMFLYVALGALHASSAADSRRLIGHYTEYCSSCITLANMGGSSGSLMLLLLYKRSVLHACMHGDTSLPYWKFHAETAAMLTFSGFHVDRPCGTSTPSSKPIASISTEARRRIVCQIFIADKFLAAFVGRPALLTRRFCSLQLPLDFDDAVLLSDKETFQRHLLRLDNGGWDMDGRLHSVSILRVRTMIAIIRDEILEIGLSYVEHNLDDIMYETQMLICNDLQEIADKFNIYDPALGELADTDAQTFYSKHEMRLDHLLNIFLVERLLLKHGHSRTDLLRTSFEMVVLTLRLWTHKHRWVEIPGESQRLLIGYAAPAGAVLCMELVDSNPMDITIDGDLIASEDYSRSSIIQQLSLLAGFLNAPGLSYPNGSVASGVRSVIKKVLDHVLNPTKRLQTPMGSESFGFISDWDGFAQFGSLDNINWFSEGAREDSSCP